MISQLPLSERLAISVGRSFDQVDQNFAFQKADPKPVSKIEIVPITQAIQPYTELNGFELTRHIPAVQF
jgi:hypothetical protein